MSFTDDFSPQDYFDISDNVENSVNAQSSIQLNSKDAAWLRSAISRYYYSAFLTLRERFLANTTLRIRITRHGSDHGTISKTMIDNLPAPLVHFGGWMEDLRDDRKSADYDLPPDFLVDKNKVKTCKLKSEAILDNIDDIMNNL